MKECSKFIRAKRVSANYGISLSTVWLYSKQKKITARKISQNVTVFSVEELDNFFSNSNKSNENDNKWK